MSYGSKCTAPKGEDIVQPRRMANCGIADKGLLDLAYRSGEISVIQAHTVYAKDEFEYQFGLEAKLMHKPYMGEDKGEPIAFYAMFKTKDGGYGFEVMSTADVREHAKKYSKAFGSGYSPWSTSFEEMAKKTVLKRVLKYAPLKSDFVRQLSTDETIKTTIGADMTEITGQPIESEEVIDPETGKVTQTEVVTEAPPQDGKK